jgi:ribose-phosphate pyrophosphokinase
MPGLIERIEIIDAADLIDDTLPADIRSRIVGVIIPDEGAKHRAGLVADRLGVPTYQARKHRDFATGKLSGFSCDPLPAEGDLLVADDICDGGGTFRGLAAAIPEAAGRLHLWVSHGVLSGRAADLANDFQTITTTDSHPGCTNVPGARVIPLLPTLMKQLTTGALA